MIDENLYVAIEFEGHTQEGAINSFVGDEEHQGSRDGGLILKACRRGSRPTRRAERGG